MRKTLVLLFYHCPETDSSYFMSAIGALRHSLQDRLSKASGKSRDEIYLKLRTSTGVCALGDDSL